jgi:hypothetical protein
MENNFGGYFLGLVLIIGCTNMILHGAVRALERIATALERRSEHA